MEATKPGIGANISTVRLRRKSVYFNLLIASASLHVLHTDAVPLSFTAQYLQPDSSSRTIDVARYGMDHLPSPTFSPSTPVEVPRVEYIPYDFLTFANFPQRKGFTKDGVLDTRRTPLELASLVQSWLYFGLLSDILGYAVTPYGFTKSSSTGDTEERTILCSSQLIPLFNAWQQQLRDLGVQRCDEQLKHVRQTIDFAIDQSIQVDQHGLLDYDQFASISLSVKLLIISLMHIYNALYPKDAFQLLDKRLIPMPSPEALPSSSSRVLIERLRQAQWCPQAIQHICSSYNFSSVFYLSQLPRLRKMDHAECSTSRCLAFNLDEKEEKFYEPKHTASGCDCQHIHVDIAKVNAIIEKGDIPLISVAFAKDGTADVSVLASRHTRAFVAISHVWSDGLGNPKTNSLPYCQLKRLHNMVRAGNPRGARVLFWIDTLCVPVGNVYKPIRRMAVDSMASIYQDAKEVVVLDAEIKQVTNSGTKSDLMAYILCSVWNTRGWTYQEAVLGKKLRFEIADGMADPPVEEMRFMPGLSPGQSTLRWHLWRVRQAPALEIVRAIRFMFQLLPPTQAYSDGFRVSCGPQACRKCLEAFHPQSRSADTVTARGRNLAIGLLWMCGAATVTVLTFPASVFFVFWGWFVSSIFGIILGCIWLADGSAIIPTDTILQQQMQIQLTSDFMTELQPSRIETGPDKLHSDLAASVRSQRFAQIWNALADRTATRSEDLHIILGSLTDMVPFRITALTSSAARMRAIVSGHKKLPLAIMFSRLSGSSTAELVDHHNRWLPVLPSGDLLPIDSNAPGMYIEEDKILIHSYEFGASFMAFQCTNGIGVLTRNEYSVSVRGRSWIFEVENDHDAHSTGAENSCFIVETKSLEGGGDKTRSLRGVRLIVKSYDGNVLECRFDKKVDVVARTDDLPNNDNELLIIAPGAVFKIPFCKSPFR